MGFERVGHLAPVAMPGGVAAIKEPWRMAAAYLEAAFGHHPPPLQVMQRHATQWQTVRYHILPYSSAGILTGVIIGMARAIGETAPIITIGALTFIAFLPPAPLKAEPPFVSFEWLFSPFTVMPIQMFNWTSRPEAAFQVNAAAAGFVLVLMTLAMNGLAIWLRYHLRRKIKW